MNWNDALTAVQDGAYLKWETNKLHEGIAALHVQELFRGKLPVLEFLPEINLVRL